MKRVLVLADLHSGHIAGLTPPNWQRKAYANRPTEKYVKIQKEGWNWFSKTVEENGPYDLLVINGDAIDGRGERSGGTELITPDRHRQCDIAVEALQPAISRKTRVVMSYGTPYHTGVTEDWECVIAEELKAEIHSHPFVRVDGVVFDIKHFLASSGVPHTRSTALNREALWSHLFATNECTEESDILIRSHVHYHSGGFDLSIQPGLRMTTPALQAMGTKYGGRKCSGLVDFGFLVFECDQGDYGYHVFHKRLSSQKVKPIEV